MIFAIITQGSFSQGLEEITVIWSQSDSSKLNETESKKIRSAIQDVVNKYATYGTLYDWEEGRVTERMIDSFETLCHPFVTLFKDYEYPAKNTTFSEYTIDAKTFFPESGIEFTLPRVEIYGIKFDEEAGYYSLKANAEKTLKNRFKDGKQLREKKTFNLNMEFLVYDQGEKYTAEIYSVIGKDESIKRQYEKQHSFGLLFGKSLYSGDLIEGVAIGNPLTMGVQYHYTSSFGILPEQWSFVLGGRLKYLDIHANIEEGTQVMIDADPRLNSITEIEFLSSGEERATLFTFEPMLGIDYALSSSYNHKTGLFLALTPRFVLSSGAQFTGSISYTETFNNRVTVSEVLNCGLWTFEGDNSVDLTYQSGILNTSIGLLLSPYYQFETSYNQGIRISLDLQYFFGGSFGKGDRFLGNYNDALNPDVTNRPALDVGSGSLIQTLGEELTELYFGLTVSYFLISK